MRFSRIAVLIVFFSVCVSAQRQRPFEAPSSGDPYSHDNLARRQQVELNSMGRGDLEARMQRALADLKSLNHQIDKLNKLSAELKIALASNDPDILSKDSLKRTDEIEKLAKNIRARMKKAASLVN